MNQMATGGKGCQSMGKEGIHTCNFTGCCGEKSGGCSAGAGTSGGGGGKGDVDLSSAHL